MLFNSMDHFLKNYTTSYHSVPFQLDYFHVRELWNKQKVEEYNCSGIHPIFPVVQIVIFPWDPVVIPTE